MFPQTLSLPPHFPPGFGDRGSPTRAGVCANGKPVVRDEGTGHLWCVCQLTSPCPPSLSTLHPLPAPPRPPSHPHPHPKASTPPPPHPPPRLPVQVPLPPFTAARGAVSSNPLAGTGMNKDFLSTRTIPIGGPYTAAAYAAYHPYLYPGYDVGPRKIAVRETTGPLKAWLLEHRKNPYPTKAEKIMLAIITQMTLTQVSTWFANARRRLKKESGGGQWDSVSDSEMAGRADRPTDNSSPPSQKDGSSLGDNYEDLSDMDDNDDVTSFQLEASSSTTHDTHPHSPPPPPHPYLLHRDALSYSHDPPSGTAYPLSLLTPAPVSEPSSSSSSSSSDVVVTNASSVPPESKNGGAANVSRPKPRIWSISAMLGLKEEEEEEGRGRRQNEEEGGDSGTTGRSARERASPPGSAPSPDCSSNGEQDRHRHPGIPRDTENASVVYCSSSSGRDYDTSSASSSARNLSADSGSVSRDFSSRRDCPAQQTRLNGKLERLQDSRGHRNACDRLQDVCEQAADRRDENGAERNL